MNIPSPSSLNKISVNNFINNYESYLSYNIEKKENITPLLLLGANPNGETTNGTPYMSPLCKTLFYYDKDTSLLNIKTLLKNKADINYIDLRGETILTQCITLLLHYQFRVDVYQEVKNIFIYLLDKGANPNGSIFKNPLLLLIEKIEKKQPYDINKIYTLVNILIAYGANPLFNTLVIREGTHNGKKNAKDSLNNILNTSLTEPEKDVIKSIKYIFTFSLDKILEKDDINDVLLSKLSLYFKINDIIDDKKELLKKIKERMESKFDEESFFESRKEERKNVVYMNEETFLGLPIDNFINEELIFLYEKEEYEYNIFNKEKVYVFHTSEIPILLKGINPYTNTSLPEYFINDLLDRYKYNECYTLEDCLNKNIYKYEETKVNNEVLVNVLVEYIKTTHPYIQGSKFLSLSLYDMIELQNIVYNKDILLIRRNVTVYDREVNRMFITDNVKERITERTLTIIIKYLQNKNNIEQQYRINNAIEQIIHEKEFRDEIKERLPILSNEFIITLLSSYTSFIEYSLTILTLNSFTEDVRSVIHTLYPLVNLAEDLNDFTKDFYYTEYLREVLTSTARRHNIFFNYTYNEDWQNIRMILMRGI